MSKHPGSRKKGRNTHNAIRRREAQKKLAEKAPSAATVTTAVNNTSAKQKKHVGFKWLTGTRAIAVFSLLISIGLWVFITLTMSNDSVKTITDVPIHIDTTDLQETSKLELISIVDPPALSNAKVDVTLSGSIYQLSRVTAEDVSVVAQVTGITRAGEYTFSLVPSCSVRNVNVKIENNYDFVKVWFDYKKQKDVKIDKVIAYGVSVSSDDLIIGDTASSIKSLRLSGPESVIDSSASVHVCATINKEISEPFETLGTIHYLDADGNDISPDRISFVSIIDYNDIEASTGVPAGAPIEDDITVMVPVSKTATLPLAISFANQPAGFNLDSLSYSLSPSSIKLEGSIDAINKLIDAGSYTVEGIDFATLSPYSPNMKLNLNLSTGIEELNGISEVNVKFNFNNYTTKTITLPNNGNFTLINADGLKAQVTTESIDIVVAGPASSVNAIGAGSCSVVVDMESYDGTPGQRKMPATVTVRNKNNCWVYGTYSVMVLVE